jgi:hypothetical protein
VPDKRHSAKHLALGIESVSGSVFSPPSFLAVLPLLLAVANILVSDFGILSDSFPLRLPVHPGSR